MGAPELDGQANFVGIKPTFLETFVIAIGNNNEAQNELCRETLYAKLVVWTNWLIAVSQADDVE